MMVMVPNWMNGRVEFLRPTRIFQWSGPSVGVKRTLVLPILKTIDTEMGSPEVNLMLFLVKLVPA